MPSGIYAIGHTSSEEHLLLQGAGNAEMTDVEQSDEQGKSAARVQEHYTEGDIGGEDRRSRIITETENAVADPVVGHVQYKVYKRRWFGLIQLVLLNIIISWDVSPIYLPDHYI